MPQEGMMRFKLLIERANRQADFKEHLSFGDQRLGNG